MALRLSKMTNFVFPLLIAMGINKYVARKLKAERVGASFFCAGCYIFLWESFFTLKLCFWKKIKILERKKIKAQHISVPKIFLLFQTIFYFLLSFFYHFCSALLCWVFCRTTLSKNCCLAAVTICRVCWWGFLEQWRFI